MKEIEVRASRNYHVNVGYGLIDELGVRLKTIAPGSHVALISDSNVWPLYGQQVCCNLSMQGFTCVHYVFPAGEASKNGETYLNILQFLAQNHITRSDILIALGGGVVGDITGFAAATYLRGIPYVQVPTTLLAMVDSSVGGKTAIDLPAGKNLVGAFYQPSLVLADIRTLDTLPENIFREGCAEVIKYGVLYSEQLFRHLEEYGLGFDREDVIAKCIALKRDVVAEDEFDTGSRQKLNLGHTVGHAIEACSHYTVSHGEAVAMGMAIIARAASVYQVCSRETTKRLENTLEKFCLPAKTEYIAEQLYSAALSDKKRTGGSVNLIIPRSIGDCTIQPTSVTELKSYIKAGL